jgi:hypothetical protein
MFENGPAPKPERGGKVQVITNRLQGLINGLQGLTNRLSRSYKRAPRSYKQASRSYKLGSNLGRNYQSIHASLMFSTLVPIGTASPTIFCRSRKVRGLYDGYQSVHPHLLDTPWLPHGYSGAVNPRSLIHEDRSVQGAVDAENSVEDGQKDEKRDGKAEFLVANENFLGDHKDSGAQK